MIGNIIAIVLLVSALCLFIISMKLCLKKEKFLKKLSVSALLAVIGTVVLALNTPDYSKEMKIIEDKVTINKSQKSYRVLVDNDDQKLTNYVMDKISDDLKDYRVDSILVMFNKKDGSKTGKYFETGVRAFTDKGMKQIGFMDNSIHYR